MFKKFSKSETSNAANKHHGVGYCGVTGDVSKRSAVEIHSGVGYCGLTPAQ